MFKVIIVDDEHLARQLMISLLLPYPEFKVVCECADGFEAFKAIQEHQPDLLFLDVQMPKLNGFELLELLDPAPHVIFTTAFDEYAIKAFDKQAIDYLLKPILKNRLQQAIQKFKTTHQSTSPKLGVDISESPLINGYQHRIVVKDNGLIRIIPEAEILYIEASDDYIKIFTPNGSYLKKSTLNSVENALDPSQFIRVHRSFLIPVNQLLRIEPYEKESHIALLNCGAKVLVSKSGMAKLKSVLGW